MKTETVVAVVSTTTTAVEITQEELNIIIKKREKDAHRAKLNSYIDEMNDLKSAPDFWGDFLTDFPSRASTAQTRGISIISYPQHFVKRKSN